MTEDQKRTLNDFAEKISILISSYKKLMAENEDLKNKINSKTELLKKTQKGLNESNTNYENLKFAKAFAASEKDTKKAKSKITNLVREINKCITLINDENYE